MGRFYYKVGQLYLLQSGHFYYKVGRVLQSGTVLLQSGTALFITKWDGYYKVGRFYYKVGQVLQSGTIITKWALTTCHSSSPSKVQAFFGPPGM